ncbi:hypothetical protein ACOAYS_003501 [Escherichia coli]
MSAQEKTVQIDSFDAKFLDINTLSKLIYERKSFVIENVSDVSETVKRVEHEIEKTKLSCRVYTEYRSTALAGSLWSPTVILGVASAVAIGVHNLSTWDPDYEIGKNYIKRRLSVKYKKAEVLCSVTPVPLPVCILGRLYSHNFRQAFTSSLRRYIYFV